MEEENASPVPAPGLYPNMDRNQYEDVFALNQSSIKIAFEKSLYHAKYALMHPSEQTEAMAEGTALHTLLLEPAKFDLEYAAMPVDANGRKLSRTTGAGKIAWAKFEDEHGFKIPMKQERIDELKEIREAVMRHKLARNLIESAVRTELSFFWEHPEYGFLCKGQLDLLTVKDGRTWAVDVKSCMDASPEGFSKAVVNYGYMIQQAWYLEGLAALAPAQRQFGFIAFEKTPPFGVGVYTLDAQTAYEGSYRCAEVSKRWAKALEDGYWPSYGQKFTQTHPKKWAMTHEMEIDSNE